MSMRPTRFAGFYSSPARSPNAALISFTVIPPLNASASRARRVARPAGGVVEAAGSPASAARAAVATLRAFRVEPPIRVPPLRLNP